MKLVTFIAALALSAAAQSQVMSFLVKQWFANGAQMCEYDNGTVLNMGAKLCPLSIKAGV